MKINTPRQHKHNTVVYTLNDTQKAKGRTKSWKKSLLPLKWVRIFFDWTERNITKEIKKEKYVVVGGGWWVMVLMQHDKEFELSNNDIKSFRTPIFTFKADKDNYIN